MRVFRCMFATHFAVFANFNNAKVKNWERGSISSTIEKRRRRIKANEAHI